MDAPGGIKTRNTTPSTGLSSWHGPIEWGPSVGSDGELAGRSWGRTNKHAGPRWGRIFRAIALGRWIKQKRTTMDDRQAMLQDTWAEIRFVGGRQQDIAISGDALSKNRVGNRPAALANWADWCGPQAPEMKEKMADRLMGDGS